MLSVILLPVVLCCDIIFPSLPEFILYDIIALFLPCGVFHFATITNHLLLDLMELIFTMSMEFSTVVSSSIS